MKKKIFFYSLMLIFLVSANYVSGQVYQAETVYGRNAKRLTVDSTLRIPKGLSTKTNASIGDSAGLIALKDTTDGVYYFTGQRWKQLGGSGSGGGTLTGSDTISLSDRINLKVDSLTTSSDSATLYYWINGSSYRIVDLAVSVTGGDTTLYNTVLDSTGNPYKRVIVAGPNNKLAGYAEFIYDSTTGIVRIQRLSGAPYSDPGLIVDGSINTNGLKVFVRTDLFNDVYMPEVGSSGAALSDSASVRPLGIDPATGKVYRLPYWPAGISQSQLNDSTAAIRADFPAGVSGGGIHAVYSGWGLLNINDSTLRADSFLVASRARLLKVLDSIQVINNANLALKLNKSDTASMLSPYVRRVVAGTNVTVDNTNAQYPIVSATGSSLPTLGTIFDNTGSFTSGNYTQGGTTFTVNASTISGNSGGVAGTYTNYIQYNYSTLLHNYFFEGTYTLGTVNSTSTGIGIGVRSTAVGFPLSYFVVYDCSSGVNTGKILTYSSFNGTTTLVATSTGSVPAATGDQISFKIVSGRQKIIVEFKNITQNKSIETSSLTTLIETAYTDALYNTGGTGGNYNIGKFTVWNFGFQGSISTLKVISNEVKNADYLCIGTSITSGSVGVTSGEAWPDMVAKDLNASVVVHAGASLTAADYLTVLSEGISLAPKNVIIETGTNDLSGIGGQSITTLQTNIATIISAFQGAGITVYLCEILPKGISAVNTYNTWLRTNYPSLVIPTFQAFTDGSANGNIPASLSSSNLHPNTYGQALLAYVIEKGIIPSYDKRIGSNSASFPINSFGNTLGRDLLIGTADNYRTRFISGSSNNGRYTFGVDDAGINGLINIVTNNSGAGSLSRMYFKNQNATGFSEYSCIDQSNTHVGILSLNNATKEFTVIADGASSSLSLKCNNMLKFFLGSSYTQYGTWNSTGLYIGGSTTPTAKLHIAAGTATANSAPLKFTAGVVLTTPESGVVETNANNELFYSTSTTAASRGFFHLGQYAASAVDVTATSNMTTIELTVTGKTATLPTAVGIQGRIYTIKLTASGTGTVATTSSQTIDGSTTYSLSAQYKYVTVQSNNANWIIIANN